MARPRPAPIEDLYPPQDLRPGYQFEDLPESVIEVADVTGGRQSALPRDRVKPGSFLVARNARVERYGTRRRDGTIEYQTAPDAEPVLLVFGIVDQTDVGKLIRVTATDIHYSANGVPFAAYTNSAPLVLDGSILRPQASQYLDDVYICGWSELLVITETTATITSIASGPGRAKYIANAADRIVLAHFEDEPYKLKWSGNADPTDWTGSSSGEENLVQGAGGIGDGITGLYAIENELVILRKQSIWIGQRQPFEAAPFRFVQDVSEVGCDLPFGSARVPGGVIFVDRLTRGVYFYQRGSYPQLINDAVCDCMFDSIQNPEWCQASFDPDTYSFVIGIASESGSRLMQEFWYYNLLTNSWTHDDGPASQSLSYFNFGGGLAIDALEGNIDDLVGDIDELTSFELAARHYRGMGTGEIIFFDPSADTDYDGTEFELELVSQDIGALSRRRTLTDVFLEIECSRAGTVELAQSKDRQTWNNEKSIAITSASTKVSARKNLVTGNHVYWRLTASSSDVLIKSWWARLVEKGLQT